MATSFTAQCERMTYQTDACLDFKNVPGIVKYRLIYS